MTSLGVANKDGTAPAMTRQEKERMAAARKEAGLANGTSADDIHASKDPTPPPDPYGGLGRQHSILHMALNKADPNRPARDEKAN